MAKSSPSQNLAKERWEILLDFWFGPSTDPISYGVEKPHWWSSNPKLDAKIKHDFEPDHLAAKAGALESWKSQPYSTLALILLLDQIPRNIYRGQPEAYATESQSIATARFAVNEKKYDTQLRLKIEKKFMYMPFNHAEDLSAQLLAQKLFASLENESWSWWANYYHGIITRFGRFPHRNAILGRESTKEEKEFLKNN